VSLDVNKLYHEFLRWFRTGDIRSFEQAERRLSQVYHAYASDAEDVSGDPVNNLDVRKFEGPLRFRGSKTARQLAQQIDDAFVAYWTGVTFDTDIIPIDFPPCPNVGGSEAFSGELSSEVTDVTRRAMYSAVLPIFTKTSNTAEQAARKLADEMDRVTTSAVTVLITGLDTSTPTQVTVTNTCTVF